MSEFEITDEGDPRKYYAQIPNLIDDMNLSVYAYRLYGHLKRVAGDTGKCFQSTKTLADACKMSMGSISKAKQELIDAGLIILETKHDKKKGYDYHEIRLIDIWAQNMIAYSQNERARSPHERANSPDERARSPHETKNNPSKNNPSKKSEEDGNAELFRLFSAKVAPIDNYARDVLVSLQEDYTNDWIIDAIEIAGKNGGRHVHYVVRTLQNREMDEKRKSNGDGKNRIPTAEEIDSWLPSSAK